jgi:hypothetical protein
MMMTILDNDLVSVLHEERRLEAAHERARRQLAPAPRDRGQTCCLPSVRPTWLRAWMVHRLSVLSRRSLSTPRH